MAVRFRIFSVLVAALAVVVPVSVGAIANERVDIGEFSKGSLDGWETRLFVGMTDYELGEDNNQQVLMADSVGSASGLGRKIIVDLTKTPYINWSWKVDRRLPKLAEQTKVGDDYAARLYVVKSGGALIWNTKALNYVWSGNSERETSWPNAYKPKNAIMFATRGVADRTGEWVTEKRNVREDFKKLFGKDITSIDAVAIMTDTDNSGRSARAAYGDIYFTAE